MRYETGSSGFIGKALLRAVPVDETIPHGEILTRQLKPYDYFYFLSGYGNMSTHTDKEKIVQANVIEPLHVLRQGIHQRKPFSSFVYFSSSSVNLPVQTMYSRTKKAMEEILMGYDLPTCIIRPYSVTGVGEQPNHLIPTLLRAAKEGARVNLVPEPRHDFVDVEDIVRGVVQLSERRGIFELGSGTSYSNQEVLEMVERVTGKKLEVDYVKSLRAYDTQEWVCENRPHGWEATKTLEKSIREMWEAENE